MKTNKVTHIIETPEYDYLHFLADLGGHLGLVMGLSVMSMFEFVAYFCICFAAIFKLFK